MLAEWTSDIAVSLSCQVLPDGSVQTAAVCRSMVELGKSLSSRLPEARHLANLLKDRGDDFEGTSQALAQIWQVSTRLPPDSHCRLSTDGRGNGATNGGTISWPKSFSILLGQEQSQKGMTVQQCWTSGGILQYLSGGCDAPCFAKKGVSYALKSQRSASIHVTSGRLAHGMSCTADGTVVAGPSSMHIVRSMSYELQPAQPCRTCRTSSSRAALKALLHRPLAMMASTSLLLLQEAFCWLPKWCDHQHK